MNNIGKINKNSNLYIIAKGFIIALILSVISILLYAVLLVNSSIGENTIKPVIIIITGVSILIGSSISCLKIKKNGIINGVLIGGLYFVSLYILSSIAFCGFKFNLSALIMICVGMILGGVGGIIGVNICK